MIEFSCRSCGATYKVGDDKAGKRGKCAKCGDVLQIPSLPQTVQQKAPAPAAQPEAAPPQPVKPAPPASSQPVNPMDALTAALSGGKTKPAPASQPAAQVQQPSQAPAAPAPAEVDNIPVARPAGGNNKLRLAIAAGVVVLLGAGVLAYFFLIKGNSDNDSSEDLTELKALLAEANKINDSAYDRSKEIDNLKKDELVKARDELTKAIAKYDEFFAAAKKFSGSEAGKIADGAKYKYQTAQTQLAALDASIWPGPGSYRDMYLRVAPSVPLIALEHGSGSGFLIKQIDKYYIVTNRHVVENSEDKFKLEFYVDEDINKEPFTIEAYLADIVYINRSADLSLIDVTAHKDELASAGIRPLVLASMDKPPGIGEHIWIVGHPNSAGSTLGILKRFFSEGSVSWVKESYLGENSCLVGINADVSPGNSGGPILNERGRVVGVVSFKLISQVTDKQNFGVHVAWLHHMFEDNKYNLSREEIERIAAPKKTLPEELKKVTEQLAAKGYKPVTLEGGQASCFLMLQQVQKADIMFGATGGKEYMVVAIGAETNDGVLQVVVPGGDPNNVKVLAAAAKQNAVSAMAEFKPEATAAYCLSYGNTSRHLQPAILAVFEK